MSFRYELQTFDAATAPAELLQKLSPLGKGLNGSLGRQGGASWAAVVEVIRALGARTLLVQRGVRDPDFLEEHHAFYSRQHRGVPRSCVRVHAFTCEVGTGSDSDSQERQVLAFLDHAAIADNSYIGFVTIRPLRHAPVGATILKAPPGRRAKAMDTFPVHIAGHEFKVSGTPFLQQDNAVGACAQASIWMALRTLRRRQGNAAFSPAELTVAATRYLASDRTFPGRQGLSIHQMLEAIRFAGHDPLTLPVPAMPANRDNPPGQPAGVDVCALLEAVGPYIESGLPVILGLDAPSGGHAVVTIGQEMSTTARRTTQRALQVSTATESATVVYRPAADWCESLTIHNDNSGPYLELLPAEKSEGHYNLDQICALIVPLPDGIFMTAAEAQLLAIQYMLRVSVFYSTSAIGAPSLPDIPIVLRVVLVTRHAFRMWAKSDKGMDQSVSQRYRTHELPPFLWVIEIHDAQAFQPANSQCDSRRGEIVLDASADPLHADCLIFATVSGSLWVAQKKLLGLLITEEESGTQVIGLTTAFTGRRIVRIW